MRPRFLKYFQSGSNTIVFSKMLQEMFQGNSSKWNSIKAIASLTKSCTNDARSFMIQKLVQIIQIQHQIQVKSSS